MCLAIDMVENLFHVHYAFVCWTSIITSIGVLFIFMIARLYCRMGIEWFFEISELKIILYTIFWDIIWAMYTWTFVLIKFHQHSKIWKILRSLISFSIFDDFSASSLPPHFHFLFVCKFLRFTLFLFLKEATAKMAITCQGERT